jgi:hypothetical protein
MAASAPFLTLSLCLPLHLLSSLPFSLSCTQSGMWVCVYVRSSTKLEDIEDRKVWIFVCMYILQREREREREIKREKEREKHEYGYLYVCMYL